MRSLYGFIKAVICAFLFGGFIIPGTADARIYTFIDEAGTIHFSNVPTDVRYKPASISNMREQSYPIQATDNNFENSIVSYEFDAFIRNAARLHEVDPLLVKSIIKAESDFNPVAVSCVGAQGLMQIMPETAKDMSLANPFDPEQNINAGTKYFRKLLGMFKGDIQLALAAYNAGPTRVIQDKRIPPFTETVRYVKKVLFNYDQYKASSSPGKRWVRVSY
jgi:soluble lytic murein transglycosylase-like protein